MKLKFSDREFELNGQYLGDDLRDSSDALNDMDTLRTRMLRDGYLLIRGLHEREQVLRARHNVLEGLAVRGMLNAEFEISDAMFNVNSSTQPSTTAVTNEALAQSKLVDAVVKGPRMIGFFERFLGTKVISFDYRWLRTAGTGASSPIHCDHVFMGRGSQNLYTCWTPLCDISFDMGPLVLCLGSHEFDAIKQTYGQCDVDRDLIAGHFTEDPLELVDRFGGRWATAEFRAGDAVVFNMYMLHASLVNTSHRVRISIDTRYQPSSEEVDDRWVGSNPIGHSVWKRADAKIEPLAVSRAKWGL